METHTLTEDPNDLNWKDKLEDVDNLSVWTPAGKNAAWEKLNTRLYQKPVRRFAWYWAAAALLITGISIPLLLTHRQQEDKIVKNDPAQKTPAANTIGLQAPPLKQIMPGDSRSAFIKNEGTIKQAKQIASDNAVLNKLPKIETVALTGLDTLKEIQAVHAISQLPVVDSPVIATLSVISPKKKLKVVHINELGDPVEEIHNMMLIADYRSFQFKLINQEVFTNTPLPPNNTGFNIFKTKNTPSN